MKTTKAKPNPFYSKVLTVLSFVVLTGALVYMANGMGWLNSFQGIESLSPAQAQAKLAQPGVVLVDVRTAQEYAGGHIAGSVLIPLDDLERQAGGLLPDRNAPLVVYCHSGRRSQKAIGILKSMGYTKLANLDGGISNWQAQGLPVQ